MWVGCRIPPVTRVREMRGQDEGPVPGPEAGEDPDRHPGAARKARRRAIIVPP
jgi:hypothetical protein